LSFSFSKQQSQTAVSTVVAKGQNTWWVEDGDTRSRGWIRADVGAEELSRRHKTNQSVRSFGGTTNPLSPKNQRSTKKWLREGIPFFLLLPPSDLPGFLFDKSHHWAL
jgi:hypothetical protein